MSLRSRLRAPLIAAASAALVGGLLAFAPVASQAAPTPSKPHGKAAMLAKERRLAKADGLTKSRAVFARSSYLCMGYKACAQAGMGSGGYAAVNDKMYWRMYAGHNCTNYAAYRMVHAGLPNERPWSGGGNATYWGTSVPSITDRVPAVGAVAWWKANVGPAGSAGHVAYVEKVVSDDEIIISQDSWGGDFSWATVTKASGNWPSGFIHFTDHEIVNKAAPVVSGAAKVGSTLKATAGTWSPSDAKVSYQWFAGSDPIARATSSTYTIAGARLGQGIWVRTTATKAGYSSETASSAATDAVLPGSLAPTEEPALKGRLKVEGTLSLDPGSWNVTPDRTTIRWYADGQVLPGVSGTSLKLAPEFAGKTISVSVKALRDSYAPVTASTGRTPPVAPGTIRPMRAAAVTGTPKFGQVLSVDPGWYRPIDASVNVQWYRDGEPVLNATGPTYKVTQTDLGALITSKVTVARAGYQTTTISEPARTRVRVAPRMSIERVRLKHAVRLRITLSSPYLSPIDGTVNVRVQGGFFDQVELHHGVARLRVTGLDRGKAALKVSYLGSPSVERLARTGYLRMP